MSAYSEINRLLDYFPLAQVDDLRMVWRDIARVELYLAELHDLTLSEVHETFAMAGITPTLAVTNAA